MTVVDIDGLRPWIGRTETATDQVTAAALAGLAATLDREEAMPAPGDPAPPGSHWLFFHPRARQSALDEVGHAKTGEFLPPAPLPRRLWAGGRLTFHRPLRVGEPVRRVGTIRDISVKQGRSGALVFILVHYAISGEDGLAVEEEHDIVYRDAPKPDAKPQPPIAAPDGATWHHEVQPDPTLLFRFSALTFNASRIHYDRPYVTEVEGYPGLIVNARLIALMLMERCTTETPAARLAGFDFRFVRPLFDTAPFTLAGKRGDGAFDLWAKNSEGHLAMSATARF
ncbi:MAG: MaoC family dehydratase N-terminal domain-containing protein [Alphaproteobacteria bacterium]|nr:MaoC family dehydratase N-terminal domain-containing protein [Alphaproteobacteria bacterium]